MTCVDSYECRARESFEDHKARNLSALERYARLPAISGNLSELLNAIKVLNKYASDLRQVQPGKFNCTIIEDTEKHYKQLIKETEAKRADIHKHYAVLTQKRKDEHALSTENAQKHNASLDLQMRTLHNELFTYKASMQEIFEHYEVTPLDTAITERTTEKDFTTMLECAIALCAKYVKRDRGVLQKIVDYLQDDDFTVPYIAALAALAIVVLYFALPFLSAIFFVKLLMSSYNCTNDIDGLRLAAALMAEIDYKRFIPEEDYIQVQVLDVSDLEAAEQAELAALHDYSVEFVQDEEKAQQAMQKLLAEQDVFRQAFDARREQLLSAVRDRLKDAMNKKDEMLKDVARFPENQKLSSVMSYKYVLSRMAGDLDVETDIGSNNLTFNSRDPASALLTLKLYLVNALLSVKPGSLRVEILDSATQCKDFSEFFLKEIDFISPCKEELSKRISMYRDLVQENIRLFHGQTIDEMNTVLEKEERICKPYNLFIIMDPVSKLYEEKDSVNVFSSFLEYSASMGVFVWLLDTVHRPHTKFVESVALANDVRPINYSFELGSRMMQSFVKTYKEEKKKIAVLPYFDTYFDKVCPPDKIWKCNTVKGIEINLGYADGDPSRPESIRFDDNNVHAVLVGGTGSGKSATINQLIATLIAKYPPSELIINFIDLKNAEAAKFAYKAAVNERDKTIPEVITEDMLEHSRVPHMDILSGTSDGAYSLSLIESLMDEMKRRQTLCNNYGVVKIEELREKYPEVVVPRILTIVDEFQQMFNKEVIPSRTIDKISDMLGRYVKLARAFGGHLLFASQSMTGTLGSDVLGNFRLRCALSCDAAVSNSVLGNNASSLLPPKGYIYTNDTAGVKADANRPWRIPFLNTDGLLLHIEKLNARLSHAGEKSRNSIIYNEARLYDFNDLDKVYAQHKDLLSDSNVFVLGAYTSYTDSKIPYTIKLKNDAHENIMVSAFDKLDILNLTSTLLENLHIKDAKIILNIQDTDTYQMLEPARYVSEELLDITSPEQEPADIIDAVEDLIAGRMDTGETTFSPVFVCLVLWERVSGLYSYKVEERLLEMLKLGPVYNVHFIFACGTKGSLTRNIRKACLHAIAGKHLEADDSFYLEDYLTTKFPNRDVKDTQGNFGLHKIGDTSVKFKIYQRDYKNQDSSRVVKII